MTTAGDDRATIYTIGYQHAAQARLIDALTTAGVRTLIDVRELPSSRRAGFSKTPLSKGLAAAGIDYVHLRALGTPKEGRVANKAKQWARFWEIVDAQLATLDAQDALAHAVHLAGERGPVCLLCLEHDHATCHRLRVAELMSARGAGRIVHLAVTPDV